MPVNIQGTFDNKEKASINYLIARHSDEKHYCLVPGCVEPHIKTHENKFSNGQTHIRRHHSEHIPFTLWTKEMLEKREAALKELNSVLAKRKQTRAGGIVATTKKTKGT
jgi:hypothetical protein